MGRQEKRCLAGTDPNRVKIKKVFLPRILWSEARGRGAVDAVGCVTETCESARIVTHLLTSLRGILSVCAILAR